MVPTSGPGVPDDSVGLRRTGGKFWGSTYQLDLLTPGSSPR
ncbi:hypothetical protein [Alloactinosynnema sp. L-07]|nr:hypothetical protein [Alloactinosynnema sp. L-07]